jgi:hypothetical protein
MNRYSTPILFIIFNRIETTKVVFEAIKAVRPKHLFIAADGARVDHIGEDEKCKAVREYVLTNINWECDIKTLFRDENLGCGYGPASAITWFFDQVEEGIILEDDCVPDSSFFEYCSELLDKYRYDDRISIISGTNMDRESKYVPENQDYFFSSIPYTWGWATWTKNWLQYDYEIKAWNKINKKKFLNNLFQDNEFQLSWRKVFDDIYTKTPTDIWDYQFFFSCFLQNKLSIVPAKNLISNIGHNDAATHTLEPNSAQANVPVKSINLPLSHPNSFDRNVEYDIFLQELCYGRVKNISYIKKIKRFFKKITRKKIRKSLC